MEGIIAGTSTPGGGAIDVPVGRERGHERASPLAQECVAEPANNDVRPTGHLVSEREDRCRDQNGDRPIETVAQVAVEQASVEGLFEYRCHDHRGQQG